MPQGMTSKRITAKQVHVDGQHDGADANAERAFARRWIDKPERFPNVIRKDQNEDERQIEKITVHVLHDEWE